MPQPEHPPAQAPPPHPLAQTLADLLRRVPSTAARFVLVLGAGSGRNIPPLLAAGVHVDVVESDAARAQAVALRFAAEPPVRVTNAAYTEVGTLGRTYVGALSTHALLHGRIEEIRAAVGALAAVMAPDAELFLTFGSTRDPRFGRGVRLDANVWAPSAGSESGVPHAYFDEGELRRLLRAFDIISLRETPVRELVGSWAHDPQETAEIVHWFAHLKASEF